MTRQASVRSRGLSSPAGTPASSSSNVSASKHSGSRSPRTSMLNNKQHKIHFADVPPIRVASEPDASRTDGSESPSSAHASVPSTPRSPVPKLSSAVGGAFASPGGRPLRISLKIAAQKVAEIIHVVPPDEKDLPERLTVRRQARHAFSLRDVTDSVLCATHSCRCRKLEH